MAGLRYLLEMSLCPASPETTQEPSVTHTRTISGQEPDRQQPETSPAPTHRHHPLSVWLAIRNEFVTGKGSLDSLCSKHGISMNTAKPRSIREKWTEKREQWLARQLAKTEPETVTTPEQPKSDTDPGSLQARIETIQTRIQEGEAALGQAENGKEFQSIATGLKNLYEIWSLLTGHEKPGIRKSNLPKRKTLTLPTPEPE